MTAFRNVTVDVVALEKSSLSLSMGGNASDVGIAQKLSLDGVPHSLCSRISEWAVHVLE